jgi:hypothetical protein
MIRKNRPVEDIFLRTKPINVLIDLIEKPRYIRELSKRNDVCACHLSNNYLYNFKVLIKTRKQGRKRYLELNKKGKETAKHFINILSLLKESSLKKTSEKIDGTKRI